MKMLFVCTINVEKFWTPADCRNNGKCNTILIIYIFQIIYIEIGGSFGLAVTESL